MPTNCSECHRLWREMDEVVGQKFRLEAQLHHAEERQRRQLAMQLTEQLAKLAQQQAILNQVMFEHEMREHTQEKMATTDLG